jgi:hypothetical protein
MISMPWLHFVVAAREKNAVGTGQLHQDSGEVCIPIVQFFFGQVAEIQGAKVLLVVLGHLKKGDTFLVL